MKFHKTDGAKVLGMYSKICTLSLLCWVVAADRYRERALSHVDNAKKSFWSLETNLWSQLHYLNETGKEAAPEVYIISEFEKFGDHIDKVRDPQKIIN